LFALASPLNLNISSVATSLALFSGKIRVGAPVTVTKELYSDHLDSLFVLIAFALQ